MGTIFVAYGYSDQRNAVLEFAVKQAVASGHELFVYRFNEKPNESTMEIREEIETIVQQIDPYVVYKIEIESGNDRSDEPENSKQDRLLNAIFDSNRDFEYVVMGEIQRGAIEGITHSSMTEAVLKKRTLPLMLVPV